MLLNKRAWPLWHWLETGIDTDYCVFISTAAPWTYGTELTKDVVFVAGSPRSVSSCITSTYLYQRAVSRQELLRGIRHCCDLKTKLPSHCIVIQPLLTQYPTMVGTTDHSSTSSIFTSAHPPSASAAALSMAAVSRVSSHPPPQNGHPKAM